jgi:hypothetical protein
VNVRPCLSRFWGLLAITIWQMAFVSPVEAREMPPDVSQANQESPARRRIILRRWAETFATTGTFPPWNDSAESTLRHLAAGAAVFRGGPLWQGAESERAALISGLSGLDTSFTEAERLTEWVENVRLNVLPHIVQYKDIGTDDSGKWCRDPSAKKGCGDYDFALLGSIALVHAFRDSPGIIPNDLVRQLLTHGQVEFLPEGQVEGALPFSGQDPTDWLTVGPGDRGYIRTADTDFPRWVAKVSTPETENHVLAMYGWRYLAQNYLEWAAGLDPSDPRYDEGLASLFYSDPVRYQNSAALTDFMLRALARFLYYGAFETNAKPYEAITLQSLLALASYAGVLFPQDPQRQKVQIAARNAVDYLAAEFALQSFEGKRISPMRRNREHLYNVHPYPNNYVPNIFGVLSGAHVFDDALRPEDAQVPPDHMPYLSTGQEAGYALWAALSEYQVPAPIHDLMLTKHSGYWARIQSSYSVSHYPLHANVMVSQTDEAPNPRRALPQYVPNRAAEAATGFAPVSQYYFAGSNFLNSAGGRALGYYPEQCVDTGTDYLVVACTYSLLTCGLALFADSLPLCGDDEKLYAHDVLARPYSIIGRGQLAPVTPPDSFLDPTGWWTLSSQTMVMPGQEDVWASKNLDTYKSFSYGYWHYDNDDEGQHLEFPMYYPPSWNAHRSGPGVVRDRAYFLFFDFTELPAHPDPNYHPLAGNYLVISRVSKSENLDRYRTYGRGFWEVVPRDRFPGGAQEFRDYVIAHNPSSYYNDNIADSYYYTMTTGERVKLHPLVGSSFTDHGILEIRAANGSVIPPGTYRFDSTQRDQPLIQAWRVDENYDFTGDVLANAPGDGTLSVNNCYLQETLFLDSSDYANPTRSVETSPACRNLGCQLDTECQAGEYCDAGVCRARSCNLSDPFGSMVPVLPADVTADGIALAPNGLSAIVSSRSGASYDLYSTTRASASDAFGPLTAIVNTNNVNTALDERAPWLSVDGLRLYFYRRSTGDESSELFRAVRSSLAGAFDTPVALASLNTGGSEEDPFLLPDEQTLLFASERATSTDIYKATLASGSFTNPIALSINTANMGDMRPVPTRDGLTIYFESRRPSASGDTDGDIWIAEASSGGFSAPTNLVSLNSSGTDFPVSLSPDGCSLYLASNRETGLGATPVFKLYRAQRQASPSQVSVSMNIVGDGSVATSPYNCKAAGGTCSAQRTFGSDVVVWASRQAYWSGACVPNGTAGLSTDGVVLFEMDGVCTVTFPG